MRMIVLNTVTNNQSTASNLLLVLVSIILITICQGFVLRPSSNHVPATIPTSSSSRIIISSSSSSYTSKLCSVASSTISTSCTANSSSHDIWSFSVHHDKDKDMDMHMDIFIDETIIDYNNILDGDDDDDNADSKSTSADTDTTLLQSVQWSEPTNDYSTDADNMSTNIHSTNHNYNYYYSGYLLQHHHHDDGDGKLEDYYPLQTHEALVTSYHTNNILQYDQERNDTNHDPNNTQTSTINTNTFVNYDILTAIIYKMYKHHLQTIMMTTPTHPHQSNQNTNNNQYNNINVPFTIHFQQNDEWFQLNPHILSSIGLIPYTQDTTNHYCDQQQSNTCSQFQIEPIQFLRHLHEYSFRHRGLTQSRIALELLGYLSEQRIPFQNKSIHKDNTTEEKGRNLISLQKQMLPPTLIHQIMEKMYTIKSNGWLSTNPDSVDGLPSLHLNLITGGKPLFTPHSHRHLSRNNNSYNNNNSNNDDDDNEQDADFRQSITELSLLLEPFLYNQLLPLVQNLTNSSTIQINDVFLRNYGRDVQQPVPSNYDSAEKQPLLRQEQQDDVGEENQVLNNSRFGLSAHYDVFSAATCVIALDSTAAHGTNGLYTIHIHNHDNHENQQVSNHPSLKRFFKLDKGDGVIHSFDVLHGVDIDKRLDSTRTSLIIWFVDELGTNCNKRDRNGLDDMQNDVDNNDNDFVNLPEQQQQPWLWNPTDGDHVKQFIYALASECKTNANYTHHKDLSQVDSHDLYMKSAIKGNSFSLNSLADICNDGLLTSQEKFQKAISIPIKLDTNKRNPFVPSLSFTNSWNNNDNNDGRRNLARALWYESAIRGGNRSAQVSLADSLMEEYMSSTTSNDKDEDLFITATTLFSMAAQQGYDVAKDALSRVMRIEYSRFMSQVENEHDDPDDTIDEELFYSRTIVQIAMLSL